jgi:Uncharacterized protein conserved in bacteria
MLTIDIEIARRFVLGKQGLWPGRRWRGIEGAEQAMRTMEYLQLDPLQIIARSQELTLHSRVLDYTPGLWGVLTYQQRKFFDWGGWLATRPMEELPYWRVAMRRERDGSPDSDPRIRRMAGARRRHRRDARPAAGARHAEQPRLRDGGAQAHRERIAGARTARWRSTICGAPVRRWCTTARISSASMPSPKQSRPPICSMRATRRRPTAS